MKTNNATLSLLLALFVGAVAFPGHASADTRASVERSLSTIEKAPSKAALLRLYGPEVESILQRIVAQPGAAKLARVRALTALRHFPSKTSQSLLAREIASTRKATKGLALLYLGQALRSYAVVVGKKALKTVSPLLAHGSIDVRIAAGEALRLSGAPEAEALISARAKSDPSATVRAELQSQLDQLHRARDSAKRR